MKKTALAALTALALISQEAKADKPAEPAKPLPFSALKRENQLEIENIILKIEKLQSRAADVLKVECVSRGGKEASDCPFDQSTYRMAGPAVPQAAKPEAKK